MDPSCRMRPAPTPSPPDTSTSAALIAALHASAPASENQDHATLFGQFVGSWDLQWSGRGRDGEPAELPGELHVGWILAGRAVQDVWTVPTNVPPGQRLAPGFHGTTIRFYDPNLGAWRSTWIDPPNGVVRRFIAQPAGAGIVLLSEDESPALRWTFTDITPDTFRWDGERRDQHDAEYQYHQHMLARRRPPLPTDTSQQQPAASR